MKIRRTAACLAAVIAAGMSLASPTAATADEVKCSTPEWTSVSVQLGVPGRWSYTYHVTWCVEGGQITGITPHSTHEADGSICVWVSNAEESEAPVSDGSGAWNALNMNEFSCKRADGEPDTVNPWGIITVRPDGTSSVLRKGIGDVIVE